MSTKKIVLVTGANGFVGGHLCRELSNAGHSVIAAGLAPEPSKSLSSDIYSYYECDFQNNESVAKLPLETIDSVINLAGLSAVGPSFENPKKYINTNTEILINLFEAFSKIKTNLPKIISVSSGAVYKLGEKPINEVSATSPSSPYVLSKLACEGIVDYYRLRGFGESISVRPFNHIGPGQSEGFLVPDMVNQIRKSQNGGSIMAGNLKTARDYTDVRDVTRAYRLLLEAEHLDYSLYNVCSGVSISGDQIVSIIKSELKREDLQIEIDPSRIRPNDVMKVTGSYDRINKEVGWKPEISIETSIKDAISFI